MQNPRMPNLPTGTVTFLYTDIEGSTRRWEQHPDLMKAALERHDALLQQAISSSGGFVFRTMGDAFCASFPTAKQALSAALASQRSLHSEPWKEEIAPLRVRMALHTGTGEVRDGDYVGPSLNRVARLLAVGSGGQILLSRTTCDLVREVLPPDVSVRDLGEHRLKDLQQPEHIFQVVAADLPADFPPLESLDRRPNNLPARQGSLIGRQEELAAIQRLLLKGNTGLLTLTGPGGVGKTRLALQLAAEMIHEFEDGAYFVDLTPVHDPGLVASAIAQVLGVREVGGRPVAESLKEHLRDKQILLVLDNFEHLIPAASLVAQLLAAAPQLRVLVTSRAALHIQGEQEFGLPPLRLPDTKRVPSLDVLARNEAVALFVQRAQLAKPDFELTAGNASAVVQVCARLDGLPLAIQLAAARIRLLPPSAMLERLEKRLKLLTGGARDLPLHQQTMRGAIAWSYELLEPGEQTLFNRLSVFAGGCTLQAADAVCNPDGELGIDMFEGIGALVDKSLLREEELRGEPRFSMLETLREFGIERLEATGEAEVVEGAYVAYFLQVAPEESGTWAYEDVAQKDWIEKLDAEQNNLRAGIGWSLQHDTDAALRLCSSLYWAWIWLGNLGEGRKWVEQALALPDAAEKAAYPRTLLAAGILGTFQHDIATARPRLEHAISLLGDTADRNLVSQALGFLAMAISIQEGPGVALDLTLDALASLVETIRQAGDGFGLATALMSLSTTHFFRGEYAAARATLEEVRALHEKQGKRIMTVRALTLLGDIARIEGDYARAGPFYDEALALARDLESRNELPSILHSLGYVALDRGDAGRARALFNESLALHLELEDAGGVAEALAGFAAVARVEGQLERSIRLYGAAKALWDANTIPLWPSERAEYERNTSAIRSQVDEVTWLTAWAQGSAGGMEQAIEYALADTADTDKTATRAEGQ